MMAGDDEWCILCLDAVGNGLENVLPNVLFGLTTKAEDTVKLEASSRRNSSVAILPRVECEFFMMRFAVVVSLSSLCALPLPFIVIFL